MNTFLSIEEIKEFGFTYEPDITKCKSLKLKMSVPELIDDECKTEIVKQIPFQYVHEVKETLNPYKDDPNFLADPKIIVVGHTRKKLSYESTSTTN